jgi:hypothetical protein
MRLFLLFVAFKIQGSSYRERERVYVSYYWHHLLDSIIYQATPWSTDYRLVLGNRMQAVIGYGGFGAVYEAEDTQQAGFHVALKETFNPESVRGFQREYDLLHQQQHQRNARRNDGQRLPDGPRQPTHGPEDN